MTKKTLKGEKYIYALMAIELFNMHKSEYEGTEYFKGLIKVGRDSGMKGGYNFERIFRCAEYSGKKMLIEVKSSPHMADFSRVYENRVYENNIVIDEPTEWVH